MTIPGCVSLMMGTGFCQTYLPPTPRPVYPNQGRRFGQRFGGNFAPSSSVASSSDVHLRLRWLPGKWLCKNEVQ